MNVGWTLADLCDSLCEGEEVTFRRTGGRVEFSVTAHRRGRRYASGEVISDMQRRSSLLDVVGISMQRNLDKLRSALEARRKDRATPSVSGDKPLVPACEEP